MRKFFYISLGILAAALTAVFIFIPSFRGDLVIKPVIELGEFQLRWYGLILAASILAGYLVARRNAWRFGIDPSAVDDFSFWLVVAGIVGARAYHVLFNLDFYQYHWEEAYKIWHGGLSIYGSVLAGLLVVLAYSRKKAYTAWQMLDLLALVMPLSQAIGRLGNFVNQEAFGLPTELPWKMFVAAGHRPALFAQSQYFHPAFLYEALGNLVLFGLLWRFRGKLRPGNLTLIYISGYSLLRFFIEGIRLDSFFWQGFRIDQVVAFALFIIASTWLLIRQFRAR